MKRTAFILALATALTGCKLGGTADGIEQDIQLQETRSQELLTITADGPFVFEHRFQPGDAYQVIIANANDQDCSVSHGEGVFGKASISNVKVSCTTATFCTADYSPVCAKQSANIQCVTTPCPDHEYRTFSNACVANKAKATISFDGDCGGLEDALAFADEPVKMVTLLVDTQTGAPFKLIKADISDDVANLTLQYSGGCGEHDFDLNIAQQLQPGTPATALAKLTHTSSDNCDALITREHSFDLLPLREFYRRQFGQQAGAVNISGIGTYSFD